MKLNRYLALFLAIAIVFLSPGHQAFAAASPTIQDSLFGDTQPKLDDGSKANYHLDVTTDVTEDEDKNAAEEAIDTAKDFFTGKALKDGWNEMVYEFENTLANIVFDANRFLTTATIKGLDIAFDYSVLNKIIDNIDHAMVTLTGVKSNGFSQGGLIGSFTGIACIVSAVTAAFLFVWKRSALGAFRSLGSTVLAMTICLLFFTQYGPFLKGMNQIATEVSQIILTGPSKLVTDDSKSSKEIRKEMYASMQDQFVHRPYLYMQYGTDDVSKIGKKRIDELLKIAPGEKRTKYVEDKEVKERKNKNMTYQNVPDRLIFTIYYMLVNTINGLVIVALMILLVAVQFWFIAIACVAPFAFLWAMFPGQIRVLKNYGFYLAEPLFVKVFLSLFTFVFFTISTLAYSLNTTSVGGYFDITIAQTGIYGMLLIFHKKVKKIFRDSKQFRYVMSEIKEFKKVTTKSLDNVAQVATTAAGAYVGGPQGAVAGYRVGEAIKERSAAASASEDSAPKYDAEKQAPLTSIPSSTKENNWTRPEIKDWRDKQNDAPLQSIERKENSKEKTTHTATHTESVRPMTSIDSVEKEETPSQHTGTQNGFNGINLVPIPSVRKKEDEGIEEEKQGGSSE